VFELVKFCERAYLGQRVASSVPTRRDRLVKELRLRGISTIGAGNELLPGFLADYNARFGKEPSAL